MTIQLVADLPPSPPILPLPQSLKRVLGAYWTPSLAFVQDLADFLQGKVVLEIFAGNGYLAGLLANSGVSITATTLLSGHDAHELGLYHPVVNLRAPDAIERHGATSDVLLVCWPTVTDSVLRAAQAWGTDKDIVFIGEVSNPSIGHFGGCATDLFFEQYQVTRKFTTYRASNPLEAALVGRIASS